VAKTVDLLEFGLIGRRKASIAPNALQDFGKSGKHSRYGRRLIYNGKDHDETDFVD
jgi:uncharacterized protein with PIN domain